MSDGYFASRPSPSAPTANTNGNLNSSVRHSSAPLPRPGGFHRRPTNMSEKAVKKGGNDYNDGHINLEHGLDILINCEVNQKDPAGITVPYRLLIPALWYDDDGDPNDVRYRKQSWIKRLGSISVKRKKGSVLAKRQGQGNWGGSYSDDSGTESESEREMRDEKQDFQNVQRGSGRDIRNVKNNFQHHKALERDPDDEEEAQDFDDVQWGSRRAADDRHDSPRGQGGRWKYSSPQERRPSKVDDMLGMAGPAENGKVANNGANGAGGGGGGGGRGAMSRFEHDGPLPPRTGLGRTPSGKGYGGIEAYKESRWRGLLRRKG